MKDWGRLIAAAGPLLALALVGAAAPAGTTDEAALRRLNREFVHAFLASDATQYRRLLRDDFLAVLSDGREVDKAEFLRLAAVPASIVEFRLEGVSIREYGETALVGGLLRYQRRDGTGIRTRYTAVFVKGEAGWQAVSAQFTRESGSAGP